MKLCIRLLALVLVAWLSSSCAERVQPFYNPSNVSIPQSLTFMPLTEIGDAIKQGGVSQSWKMTDDGPGKIKGVFRIRTHKAIVRIDYSTTNYSITYVSSVNLLDNGVGIHRNYNKWVRELETSINAQLQKIAAGQNNTSPSTNEQAMLEAWKKAEKSNDPLVLQEFMDEYGDGPFAAAAQKRLDELAQIRTGVVKKFDPTGLWQVTVTYKGGNGNSSWCSREKTWNFILDFTLGKISRTVWSDRFALYVTGENSDDYVNLHFEYPLGGSQWKYTERFQLDSDEKRLTLKSEGGAPSGCTGTLGVHMKKTDSENNVSGSSSTVQQNNQYTNGFDPTGQWQVTVTYRRVDNNISWCPKNAQWNFVLDFKRGKFSRTFWDGSNPLFVTGQNDDDFVDLKLNGAPHSGEFKWTDRFTIKSNEERFVAKAEGGCPGTMNMYMKKI